MCLLASPEFGILFRSGSTHETSATAHRIVLGSMSRPSMPFVSAWQQKSLVTRGSSDTRVPSFHVAPPSRQLRPGEEPVFPLCAPVPSAVMFFNSLYLTEQLNLIGLSSGVLSFSRSLNPADTLPSRNGNDVASFRLSHVLILDAAHPTANHEN